MLAPPTAHIKHVQNILNRLGYKAGIANGVSGPNTVKAIKAYQKDMSLPEDGEISQWLINALQKTYQAKADAAWARAKSKNTPGAYREFLKTYPDTAWQNQARGRFQKLQRKEEQRAESRSWATIKSIKSGKTNATYDDLFRAYRKFLNNFPKSRHAIEVRRYLAKTSKQMCWYYGIRAKNLEEGFKNSSPESQNGEWGQKWLEGLRETRELEKYYCEAKIVFAKEQ